MLENNISKTVGEIRVYSFALLTDEKILKKDLANLYCDGEAFNGAFYLTSERIVFVGYLLDIRHKYIEEVPLSHIRELRQEKAFFLIPNVLIVTTIQNRILKIVVTRRSEWYQQIQEQIDNQ